MSTAHPYAEQIVALADLMKNEDPRIDRSIHAAKIGVHLLANITPLVLKIAADWGADHVNAGMDALHEKAGDFAKDYESAAREAGWYQNRGPMPIKDWPAIHDASEGAVQFHDWKELCDAEGIEPHERKVYEYWIVSDWLAERMAANGQKVDMDFGGQKVWARIESYALLYLDPALVKVFGERPEANSRPVYEINTTEIVSRTYAVHADSADEALRAYLAAEADVELIHDETTNCTRHGEPEIA